MNIVNCNVPQARVEELKAQNATLSEMFQRIQALVERTLALVEESNELTQRAVAAAEHWKMRFECLEERVTEVEQELVDQEPYIVHLDPEWDKEDIEKFNVLQSVHVSFCEAHGGGTWYALPDDGDGPARMVHHEDFDTVVKPWLLERGVDLDDEKWENYLDIMSAYEHCSDEDAE